MTGCSSRSVCLTPALVKSICLLNKLEKKIISLNVINLHLAPQSKKFSFEQLRSTATTTTKLERLNRYSKERMIRADHSHREGFKHGADG